MKRKDLYLRFCCFLTGLSYPLIRNASEQSVKNAKKYTGALLIIMLVWFFIGYCFATRYLQTGITAGIAGGLLMAFIILQIERIIILSHHVSLWGKLFRGALALVMAILGAMIMDQFAFKDDIEIKKAEVLESRVEQAIKNTSKEIRTQIADIDSTLAFSNERLFSLSEELQKRPVIITKHINSVTESDSLNNPLKTVKTIGTTVTENPLGIEFNFLKSQIDTLNQRKFDLQNRLSNLRITTAEEMKDKTGFLDELKLLKQVIMSDGVGLFVYALFFFFFLALELFILVMKLSDKKSDYEKLIDHQVEVNIQRIDMLKA